MTQELRRQHDGLTAASELIDRRRRFTEAVLAGVSPGVIGVDAAGLVTIANPSIERTLGLKADAINGKPLVQAVPELQASFRREGRAACAPSSSRSS